MSDAELTKCDSCGKKKSNFDKWKYTLITTILFVIVAHPMTYQTVESLLGKLIGKIAVSNGCPTNLGLFVHAVVFTLLLRGLMELKI